MAGEMRASSGGQSRILIPPSALRDPREISPVRGILALRKAPGDESRLAAAFESRHVSCAMTLQLTDRDG